MTRRLYRAYLDSTANVTGTGITVTTTAPALAPTPAPSPIVSAGTAAADVFVGTSGADTYDGRGGNDQISGGDGNDKLDGSGGNDWIDGGKGNDTVSGGAGEDSVGGGDGNDDVSGGAGRDYLTGGAGNDVINGGSGRDVILAGGDNDRVDGGTGGDVLLLGTGDDTAWGGVGRDYVSGDDGNDVVFGGSGADAVFGGRGDDVLDTGDGDDTALDGEGNDQLKGGNGADSLGNSAGNDTLLGGKGADRLVSWGDAGEPDVAQGGSRVTNAPTAGSSDVLTGGDGADNFYFQFAVNAKSSIIAKYTDANTGRVDWKGVTGENGHAHDHWVDSIGNDTITDFHRADGDLILIEGHTVEVARIDYVDANTDGITDYSVITLISQQGASGAHDEDLLGTITVYGDKVTMDDIHVHSHPVWGVDTFAGKSPVYGTLGDDEIADGRGSQVVYGDEGNDVIIAWGDGGEPIPKQNANGQVYTYEPAAPADDVFIGGHGSDVFDFRALINAKQEILDRHRNGDGTIDWVGVTGENGNVHDHWVEGFGNDVVYDFDAGGDGDHGGDMIMLEGHTLAYKLEYRDTVSAADTDTTPDYTVITLYSDQGNAGAHNKDPLGTITVYGDLVDASHIMLHAHAYWGIDSLEGAVA